MNPGSDAAIRKGCTCDPANNHYGKGHRIGNNEPLFFKDDKCVLHGTCYAMSDLSKAMEKSYDER